MHRIRLMCGVGSLAIAASLMSAAMAQTAVTGAAAKNSPAFHSKHIEEVMVTAERRSVSVQKTPISIVALSGKTLAARGVVDLNSLQTQVPSLSYVDNGNTKYINIRGIGLDESSPNQTNGVAVNDDGAYVAREFNLDDPFFDLSDVEVLRGPQGTYQGQNASGGAVYINSMAPVLNKKSASADFSYGSYNHTTADAVANMPLSDIAAVRISVLGEKRDSYYHNYGPYGSAGPLQTGNQPGNLGRIFARAQLLLAPTDDFKLRLIAQRSEYLSDGPAFQSYARPANENPWQLNYDTPGKLNISYNRETAIADWNAPSAFRVHAVAAYQNTDQQLHQDTDFTSPFVQPTVPQETNDIHITDHYYTGELDLISKNNDRFDWTTGATILDYTQQGLIHGTSYNTPSNPQLYSNPQQGLVIFVQAPRQNQAVFGEVGYKIIPTLELKIGGRFNHDHLGFDPDSYLAPGGPGSAFHIPLHPPYVDENTFTGRALLTWTPDDGNMFYVTVSRGYKPGGTTPFADVYAPEYVINTEGGWKGSLFEGHVHPSISIFSMDYKNYQATVATDPNNPTLDLTKNITGTTDRGVDAQITSHFGAVSIDASGSYLDTKYGNLRIFLPTGALGGGNPTSPIPINLGGRQLDYAPEFSGNIGISYDYETSYGSIMPSLRYKYQSSQWAYFFDMPYDRIPAHGTTDLNISYQSNGNWQLQGYITNLLNVLYVSNVYQSTDGIGEYTQGAPREFGAKFSYNF